MSSASWLNADLSIHNFDNLSVEGCAANCFAATQAISTVPYFSLGQARSVSLLYTGDQVASRPVVAADISLASGAPGSLQEYWLEAKDSAGTAITFINGDTKLRFSAPATGTTKVRLAGQFDAEALGYSSGVYPITLVVTAKWASSTDAMTIPTKFMVVSERKSPVARGWVIGGLSRIRALGNDVFISEGSGSGKFFVGCGYGCFVSPFGDYTRLLSNGSGASLKYVRLWPDSSRAEYDLNGYLLRTITRLQDTTSYTYDGSGRLTQISDPSRTNGGTTHLYTALAYGTYGLSSITEPGPNNTQAGGRVTQVSVSSTDSTLTWWKDPDLVQTSFGYDASKRLSTVTNRRGDVTTFKYNATTWKLDSLISPSFTADARLYGAGATKQLKTKYKAWQTVAVPTTTTATTPFAYVLSDTVYGRVTEPGGQVSRFTADRWGQPIQTKYPLGDATEQTSTVYRQPMRALADSTRSHQGLVHVFDYDRAFVTWDSLAGMVGTKTHYGKFAQVDSVSGANQPTQLVTLGARGRTDSQTLSGTSTTTSYGYDSRQRVITITDPTSQITSLHYETTFGNQDSTKAPGNRTTRTRFDGFGRDTASQNASLPWRITKRDTLNRVTKQYTAGAVQPDTVVATYDNLNRTQLRIMNNTYGFTFNAIGHVTQRTDPSGKSDLYYFDDQGQPTTWINRRVDTVTTTFDAMHRRLVRGGSKIAPDTMRYGTSGLYVVASNRNAYDSTTVDSTGFVTKVFTKLATDPSKTFTRLYTKTTTGRFTRDSIATSTSIQFATRRYIWKDQTGVLDTIRLGANVVDQLGYNAALHRVADNYAGGQTRRDSLTSIYQPYEIAFSQLGADSLLWRSSI